jgi:ATP phosphoribosyltransferase regulatory subunit
MDNPAILRAFKINDIIQNINNILNRYGYLEIFLPIYEYYDVLKDAVKDFSDENIIRFIDRNTGKSMVLRPDFTPQICRTVSNYITDFPLPVRLSYNGRIFRNVDIHKGLKAEKYQCGLEIFGIDSHFAELEVLSIVNDVIKKFNIENTYIILGDMKLIDLILCIIPDKALQYKELLILKDIHSIKKLVSQLDLDNNTKGLLNFMPLAFGSIEILYEIKEKAFFNKEITSRITELIEFFKLVDKYINPLYKIVFDAAELRGLNYYSGLNFDIVKGEKGVHIGGGGRYDNLMQLFGPNLPACGLAFNIDELIDFVKIDFAKRNLDCLIVGKEKIDRFFELKDKGFSVFYMENTKNIDLLKKIYSIKNII